MLHSHIHSSAMYRRYIVYILRVSVNKQQKYWYIISKSKRYSFMLSAEMSVTEYEVMCVLFHSRYKREGKKPTVGGGKKE